MTTPATQARALPPGAIPLGLSRAQAAAYVGVSTGLFDRLVAAGRMPQPKRPSEGRTVWDRRELEAAFAALPTALAPPAGTPGGAPVDFWLDRNPFDEPE